MSLMLRKWILSSIIKSVPVKKPIVQLSRIECLPDDSQLHRLACISDKEKFIRAVFTKDSLAQFQQDETSFDDLRGGLISLQDYALIASLGTDRRYSEYFVEVHKFTFIGGERNMPFPTVTNVNLDEKVQSKLAHLWREAQLNRTATDQHSSSFVVYSQVEEAPQLSQDELSMLLIAMSEQSQVDSIEAISSSQIFDLENIPGWVKPEKDLELTLTQETEYTTPLLGSCVTVWPRDDQGSHYMPESDLEFITPPQQLTSVSADDEGLNHQEVFGGQDKPMEDSEVPLDPTTISAHSSTMLTPLHSGETVQCTASPQEEVIDSNESLKQAIQSVPETLMNLVRDNQETVDTNGTTRPNPIDGDDFSVCCKISDSQVKDLDAIWARQQPLLSATDDGSTAEQSCINILAPDTPSNRHTCNDNDVNNNGCPEQNTTASSRRQEGNQRMDKQDENKQQQIMDGEQYTSKGKGGTTKGIHHIEKLVMTSSMTESDNVIEDSISPSSISLSQQDELDEQWVQQAGDDEADNLIASSPETFEDLHPFQLASLPDPSKHVASGVNQSFTEDSPGPSTIVAVTKDTGNDLTANQEERRRKVFTSDDDFNMETYDQHLFADMETGRETSPNAKMHTTSIVSTAAITRLLDVSNRIPPVTVGDKTTSQSATVTGNTRLTPSRAMASSHNKTQSENLVKDVMITSSDSDGSGDIVTSKECIGERLDYHFKPLITEEDIDEFIDNYWTLHRLRTYSF